MISWKSKYHHWSRKGPKWDSIFPPREIPETVLTYTHLFRTHRYSICLEFWLGERGASWLIHLVGIEMIRNFIVEENVQVFPAFAKNFMPKVKKRLMLFWVAQVSKCEWVRRCPQRKNPVPNEMNSRVRWSTVTSKKLGKRTLSRLPASGFEGNITEERPFLEEKPSE